METQVKNKYKNLLILLLAALAGFFLPLAGFIILIILEVNKDKPQLMLTADEKMMTRIGLVVIGIYYLINIVFQIQNWNTGTSEDTLSSLLRLLIFIK